MAEHSKKQMQAIVDFIGDNQQKFDDLITVFLTGEYRIIQRASWPLSNCAELHPPLINKHYKTLIAQMKNPQLHPAVRRNVLRIFETATIPKKYHGNIMNECFTYLENPNEAIAVHAYALGILKKLSKIYPEIKQELVLLIEARLPNATPAFTSRAKHFMKAQRST